MIAVRNDLGLKRPPNQTTEGKRKSLLQLISSLHLINKSENLKQQN